MRYQTHGLGAVAAALAGVSLLLAGCGASTTTSNKSATKKQPLITAKFGSTSPVDSLGGASAAYFAQQVLKDSGGRIKITVYPDSELGGTPVINQGLQAGTIQFTSNDILDQYVPSIDVFNTAYLFPSEAIADSVLNSTAVRKLIWNQLDSHGIHMLEVWPSGFTDIFSTQPIGSPQALKGLKIRTFVPNVETPEYQAVGADATDVVYDQVFTALSSHLIQAVTDPPDLVTPLKWQQAAPYVSIVNMAYVTTPLLVSESFWKSLDSVQQAEISRAAAASLKFEVAQLNQYNAQSLQTLEQDPSVHILHPSIAAFKSAFSAAYPTIQATFPVLLKIRQLVKAASK